MSQPDQPPPKGKKCPICCTDVRDIMINNEETLEMCTNTKCIYPFSRDSTMTLKCNGKEEHINAESNKSDDDVLRKLLDEVTSNSKPEMTTAMSDVISDLISSHNMLLELG